MRPAMRLARALAPRSAAAQGSQARWMASASSAKARKGSKPAEPTAAAASSAADSAAALQDLVSGTTSNDDLMSIFEAVDAQGGAAVEVTEELPVKVSGPHADSVEFAFAQAAALNKKDAIAGLETLTAQLKSVQAILMGSDYSVFRFFTEADYLPKETQQAVGLLLTTEVNLSKLDAIADDDLREYFLVDDATAGVWADCRQAIRDLKLSPQAVAVVQRLGDSGTTHQLARILGSCDDILAAASTVARAVVTSAVPLSSSQQKDVVSALGGHLDAKKKTIAVEYAVDPAILGGLMVQLDDKVMDVSASSILMAQTGVADARA